MRRMTLGNTIFGITGPWYQGVPKHIKFPNTGVSFLWMLAGPVERQQDVHTVVCTLPGMG